VIDHDGFDGGIGAPLLKRAENARTHWRREGVQRRRAVEPDATDLTVGHRLDVGIHDCILTMRIISLPERMGEKMKKGVVKMYNQTKGFGFVKEDITGVEFFVDATVLKDNIKTSDIVVFDLTPGRKGLTAINVRLA
jgi:CspA family cold shock protein